ncbi:hypothetical protein A3800_15745 [Streptomyces badius]|nr:hypothetical protein A3838_15730 [Streptomyces badius]RAN26347.1 hypothetical protein A3800_15745 [Streptomyces badius]
MSVTPPEGAASEGGFELPAAAPTAVYPSSGPLPQPDSRPVPRHSAAAEAAMAVPRRPVEPYV